MRNWKTLVTTLFVGSLIFIGSESFTRTSGPGGGYTNAKGEQDCTSCHSGSLIDSGAVLNNLTLKTNFFAGGYVPDSTYDFTVAYSQSGISKWGFQITVLDQNHKKAGTLTSSGTRNQKRTKVILGASRDYIEHTSTGTASTSTGKTDWTFKWKAPSGNVGDLTAYVVVNAASGGGTGGDKIYAKEFKLAPSSLLPVATAKASDTLVCSSTTVTLTGAGTNSPTSWDWDIPGASPNSSTKQSPTVVFTDTGTHKVTLQVTNSKGKSPKDTVVVVVKEGPVADIFGASVRNICRGGSVQLTASFNPRYKYKWSNGKTGNKITVSDTGAYYVTTTYNGCSKVSNLVHVKYFPLTSVSLSSDAVNGEACVGSNINFTASSGYDSVYLYKNSQYVQTYDTHQFAQKMQDTASYSVQVLDANGCRSAFSDTVVINVASPLEAPTVSCTGVTTNSATFGWVFNGHPKGYQISMDTGKTWTIASSGPTGLTHTMTSLSADKSYTLLVRAIGDGPCVFGTPGSAVCKTSSCNTLTLTHSFDSAVCFGDSVRVEINGLKGQNYSLSFENNGSFQDTMFYFSPDFSKTYTVFVTDSNAPGCAPEELDMKVRVDKIKQVVLSTQNANHQFCNNDTIQFTATEGNDTYEFFVNGDLKVSTSDSFYFENQYNNGDSAWVEVQKGVCESQSEKIHILVFPESDAGFTYSYANGMVEFKPNVGIHQSYFWDFGDESISVQKEVAHQYSDTFEGDSVLVNLSIVDNNGCKNDTSINVYIPFFSSIGEVDMNSNLHVYPNPAEEQIFVELGKGSLHSSHVRIYTVGGELLWSEYVQDNKATIKVSDWKSGFYIIEVESKSGHKYRKTFNVQ